MKNVEYINMENVEHINMENVEYINVLGGLCSAIQLLPTSAVLSKGLVKQGTNAFASGGQADIWKGNLDDTQVAIKAFRIYPTQTLEEAKKVS